MSTNYIDWTLVMKINLRAQGLWETIKGVGDISDRDDMLAALITHTGRFGGDDGHSRCQADGQRDVEDHQDDAYAGGPRPRSDSSKTVQGVQTDCLQGRQNA